MPTNLGNLPANARFANGKVQIKRGAADTAVDYSNAHNGWIISDGAGGDMRIVYTTTYPCWWIVHSNVMAHGYPDGAGWRRWDHSLYVTPADAYGVTQGFQCPHQNFDNSTVEWRTVGCSYTFKLNAGITYTAYMTTSYCSAGTVQVHTGPMWLRLVGRIVGEGML